MITTTDLAPYLRALADVERTDRGTRPHRLPRSVRERFPDPQLLAAAAQPSGVRLAFRTTATRVELDLHPTRRAFAGAERPRGRVDLVVDGAPVASDELGGGDVLETDLRTGTTTPRPGPAHTAAFTGLPGRDKAVELWLPHDESVELFALRTDAGIAPATDTRPSWVHHGSSISQGSNATGPTATWPAVAARGAGVQLRNLGFGGSAMVDPFVARTIRDLPADVISLKLGINVVNLDAMRLRAFVPALHGLLDTIRDGHPTTPLLLVTPVFCGVHEDTPGPGSVDAAALAAGRVRFVATGTAGDTALGRLTLRVIREAMAGVVARRDDPALRLVSGLNLYGPADADELPLPDGLHPDTAAHARIGERFARVLASSLAGVPDGAGSDPAA
jgi:hypothetical protein